MEKAWQNIVDNICDDYSRYSSEKTLCFNYAWELKTEYKKKIKIDFEKQIFGNDFIAGKFLDLYAEIHNENGLQRIGIEFKYIKSREHNNSNQTQNRVKIVNDLKRLTYLVDKKKVDQGYFFCITNERAYTTKGDFSVAQEFIVSDGTVYNKGDVFPIIQSSCDNVTVLNPIRFEWESILNDRLHVLKPIKIVC